VATSQDNSPLLVRAVKLLAQMGEELAFVEAGQDTDLLPINSSASGSSIRAPRDLMLEATDTK